MVTKVQSVFSISSLTQKGNLNSLELVFGIISTKLLKHWINDEFKIIWKNSKLS